MHRRFKEWHTFLKEHGYRMDSNVNAVDDKLLPQEFLDKHGLAWTAKPADAGIVRISRPQLPHGAKGPCQQNRRLLFPWFAGVDEDHRSLDIPESVTWQQAADAHAKQTLLTESHPDTRTTTARYLTLFPQACKSQGWDLSSMRCSGDESGMNVKSSHIGTACSCRVQMCATRPSPISEARR